MTRDEIVNRIVAIGSELVDTSSMTMAKFLALYDERAALKVRLGQLDADAAERRRDIADKWRDHAPNHDGNRYEPY